MTCQKWARFRVAQSLNAYPTHYRLAFASSGILYPPPYRLTSRFAFLTERDGLTTFHVSTL